MVSYHITLWGYNTEDRDLNLYPRENLKSLGNKWRQTGPSKPGILPHQSLHGVTTQNTMTSIFIAMKTSNLDIKIHFIPVSTSKSNPEDHDFNQPLIL